jgi:hypothetical protein
MNKFIILFLFFISHNVFSQEYYFDRVLQYNLKGVGLSKHDFTDIFINSKNNSYYFSIGCYGNEIKGHIYDSKKNLIHYYTIDTINKVKDFKYLFSKTGYASSQEKSFCSKITTTKEKNSGEFFRVTQTRFKNKKKEKKEHEIEFFCKPYDIPILSEVINSLHIHYFNCEQSSISEYYIPTQIKIRRLDTSETERNLDLIKDIEMTLSIKKEELNYKMFK